MGRIETWYRSSGPLAKVFMAISITSAFVVCHKMLYAPYVRRGRFKRAEEWANAIIEEEEKAQEMGVESSNNISY